MPQNPDPLADYLAKTYPGVRNVQQTPPPAVEPVWANFRRAGIPAPQPKQEPRPMIDPQVIAAKIAQDFEAQGRWQAMQSFNRLPEALKQSVRPLIPEAARRALFGGAAPNGHGPLSPMQFPRG